MKVQGYAIVSLTAVQVHGFGNSNAGLWFNMFKTGTNGNSNLPPPPPPPHITSDAYDFEDEGEGSLHICMLGASICVGLDDEEHDTCTLTHNDINGEIEAPVIDNAVTMDLLECSDSELLIMLRGGGNDIIEGSMTTLETARVFWSDQLQSMQTNVSKVLANLTPTFKKNKDEGEIDPSTVLVKEVVAPESIVPTNVIKASAMRSGLTGNVMKADKVTLCARMIKKWYDQRGYVLHSVTGATLDAEKGTATLLVQEPVVNEVPLDIKFAKEVPIDPETGQSTTMRQYRAKLQKQSLSPIRNEDWAKVVSTLNTTLIQTSGRTRRAILSKHLDLSPGNHFSWDKRKWQKIAGSGLFQKIWKANPARMKDGTVQFQILAQEPPPRNLEYGISKSLYTGKWEGELDFTHQNLFGAGESLALLVRRGAKDPEPSFNLRFSDDKFGLEGGYSADIFSEFIAIENYDEEGDIENDEGGTIESPSEYSNIPSPKHDEGLLSRKGLKLSLRNPISKSLINSSSASASMERTSTRTGSHENIGSFNIAVGPFRKEISLAKTDIMTSVTTGARVGEETLLPYTSASATTRQAFPLFTQSFLSSDNRFVNLALRHTLMSSTRNLPRHEANAAGFAARVRGSTDGPSEPVGSYVMGSTELRIPMTIPFNRQNMFQDASVVLFGDYMAGIRRNAAGRGGIHEWAEEGFHKSSIGVGLRKSLQGIPVKYDFSISSDGKIGTSFSLGRDWDI